MQSQSVSQSVSDRHNGYLLRMAFLSWQVGMRPAYVGLARDGMIHVLRAPSDNVLQESPWPLPLSSATLSSAEFSEGLALALRGGGSWRPVPLHENPGASSSESSSVSL